jgi:hypothetical protein
MDDNTPSTNSDRLVRRANQILSAVVASAVLGVGGVMAYQNRDAVKVPDRNAAWAGVWTKKLSDNSRIPKFNDPEAPTTIDWEKVKFYDPSKTTASGLQFNPGVSNGGNNSSMSNRRR